MNMAIHFLPGMGADARLWQDYHHLAEDASFHDWPKPSSFSIGIEAYARQLIDRFGIIASDVLVGASMGGMLAAEIQRLMPRIAVIQVSSCTHPTQLRPIVRRLAPLIRYAPLRLAASIPNALLPGRILRLAHDMYRKHDPDFIRWSCHILLDWQGLDRPGNLYRILGDRDHLFPLSRQTPDLVISGGSHLMTLTQPRQVSAAIDARLGRLS
ncbi:hypothetical protein LBMAG53_25250 [Planctomycetota bacterium]|nr:hypothetical protein LBMAG53_25250 [Planctomycetota bacterium]